VASKVDPAALLLAVLAAATTPLVTEGPWHWLNTVLAAVALVVLLSYWIAADARSSYLTFHRCLAAALPIGLIATVVVAWPLQEFVVQKFWNTPCTTKYIDRATGIALGLGGLAAVGVLAYLLRSTRLQRGQRSSNPTNASRNWSLEEENAVLRAQREELKRSLDFWIAQATAKRDSSRPVAKEP
jgi:hypothetical protein